MGLRRSLAQKSFVLTARHVGGTRGLGKLRSKDCLSILPLSGCWTVEMIANVT
jgi:hypothetical protein